MSIWKLPNGLLRGITNHGKKPYIHGTDNQPVTTESFKKRYGREPTMAEVIEGKPLYGEEGPDFDNEPVQRDPSEMKTYQSSVDVELEQAIRKLESVSSDLIAMGEYNRAQVILDTLTTLNEA